MKIQTYLQIRQIGQNITRIPFGNDSWAYLFNIYPQSGATTTDSIRIFSEWSGISTSHDVYVINGGDYCFNPTIDVIYERIDVDSPFEYFEVYDQFDGLIERCPVGNQSNACGVFASCIDDYDLGISSIAPNQWYQIVSIRTSRALNDLCLGGNAFNAILTITCPQGTPQPTTTQQPTPQPTTGLPTVSSPNTTANSRYPFGNSSWLYVLRLFPQDGATTTDSIDIYTEQQNAVTNHDVYVINDGDDCFNPTIDVIYERIDLDSSFEYFDVFDRFDGLIQRCGAGSESNSCGQFATCVDDYDLGISQISSNQWYQIVNMETSTGLNDFCPGENAFNARLSVTCSG